MVSGLEERDRELAAAGNAALLLVQGLAAQQDQLAVATKQMLITLAHLPQVQSLDADACNRLFRELNNRYPIYSTISAVTAEGRLFAASAPFEPGSINLSDRRHVKEAIRTRDFSAGEYIVGRVSHKTSINYSYPVLDADNNIIAIVIAGVRLDKYDQFMNEARLPKDSMISIVDHSGTRLYRSPINSLVPIGKPVVDGVIGKIFGDSEQESFEMVGGDGVLRIYAFKKLRLSDNMPAYLYAIAGISKDKIISNINYTMILVLNGEVL